MALGYITVNPDSSDAYSVEFEEGILPIGRKPAASGQLKLVLPVPEVSARHAEIRATASGWTIVDAGSTNGTRLNGEWLSPGREYPLRNGDQVKIAHVDLLISLPEDVPLHDTVPGEDETHFRINLIKVTILVGDIRGFTTLMEQYASQPEIVMQSAHNVFQALKKEIMSNKGTVEKIAGDAILAYWQEQPDKPNAHAHLACSTALKLRSLVTTVLSKDENCWQFKHHPLYLDMALATGAAASGPIGRKEANPALLGDTANLAFRMEKLISDEAPGDIVVDGNTYALVEDGFDFKALGQFDIKGRQKPVDLHRLVGASRS